MFLLRPIFQMPGLGAKSGWPCRASFFLGFLPWTFFRQKILVKPAKK